MSGEMHAFNHQAMTTWWQVRICGGDKAYAAQAAQAAFAVTDRMERLMSRFRDDSEITSIAALPPGGRMKLTREVFDCLRLASDFRDLTDGSFDIRAAFGKNADFLPRWTLHEEDVSIVAEEAPCRFDLGAIAKGFTLDCMASELLEWGVESYLLMSAGSSMLAGNPPEEERGWKVRIGEGPEAREFFLSLGAIGTSGTSMRGAHIIDPPTGSASNRYLRSWVFSRTAAEADALSTAWMNMDWEQAIRYTSLRGESGAIVLNHDGTMRHAGTLPVSV